jgi:putative hydrolase of the HAD superfamily
MSRLAGGVKAVFLDVGETLVYAHPSSPEIMAQICAEEGLDVSVAQIEAADRAVGPRLLRRQAEGPLYSISAENSQRFWTWVYNEILQEAGVPESHRAALSERFHRCFNTLETWRLFPDALPALEAIHKRRDRRGLISGVVSNWEDWLETLLTHLDIDRYFDFSIISAAVQLEKPNPAIFHAALDRAGVPPQEVLHVGDSLHADVGGARAAGIHPVLLDRRGRYTEAQAGDATIIRSLAELPALLD